MMLPNGWKKVKLGQIMSFKNGLNFSQVSNGKELNFLGVSNFKSRKFISSEAQLDKIYLADFPNDDYLLKKDDLVFVRSNGSKDLVGRCVKMNESFSKTTFSGFCIRGRLSSSETTADYILHFIECGFLKDKLRRESRGTNISNLNQDILDDFDIMLPPIEEQKKIAATLSVWDSAIEKMEKLIEVKYAQKKSLTCKLIEKSSEAKFKLGNVTIDKSKWGKKKFKDVFEFLPTNTYSRELMSNDEGSIKNIHYGDVLIKYAELLDVSLVKIPCLKSSVDSSKMFFLQSGDIVIADTAEDETVGKAIEILNIEDHLVVSGLHTMLCRPQKEMFYHGWLGYYINSKEFHRQLIPLITGIKVSSIAKKDIIDTFILIPSLQEQKIIVETLSETNKEISLLKQQLENYKKQKQGLMQKLLTGQWRVK